MKRLVVAGVCAFAAAAIGTAIAAALSGKSGLYGLSPTPSPAAASTTPGSAISLLELETQVLTRQGISPERASQTIRVQGELAQTNFVSKVEAALAGAYGGAWFEPATAQLHIGVTSPASRQTAEGVAARAGFADTVIATPVRSTWDRLQSAQAQLNHRLANLFARAEAQTALAPQSNAVTVTLSSSAPMPERAAIERDASQAGVDVVVTVVPYQLSIARDSMATECNAFASGEAYCNKTLTSGVTIRGGGTCTAGPMAIPKASKSQTYLLTAGHCITEPGSGIGSKWFAFNRSRTKEEIGPTAEFVDNTKADVAAIKINNPGYWVESTKNPVFADTAEWSTKNPEMSYPVEGEREPIVGNMNCLEGQTTGQSCGVVTKLNVTNGFAQGLIEDGGGAKSAGGDSGGPWLFITTKSNLAAFIEGTHVGKNVSVTNPVFEPLKTAFKELTKLNLELLTTANEVRP